MVLGVHGQVVDRRGLGQVLRHRPGHQHAVAFQPEVVVQPAGVVLLDDEACRRCPSCGLRFGTGSGVFDASRMLRYFVSRSATGHRLVERRQQVAVARDPLEHLVEAQLPQLGVVDLVPGARRRDGRMFASAQRVRRDRRLRRRCSGSSPGTPCRPAGSWSSSTVTSLGIAFSSCCATRLANTDAPRAAHRLVQRRVEVQALAAAGERIGGQPDVGDQVADGARHLAQLRHRDALAGVEVEHQAGRRARLQLFARCESTRRRTATAARAPPARPAGRSRPVRRRCR